MENKENFIKREIVTKENLPFVLTEIAIEREKKGTSKILIPRIHSVREQNFSSTTVSGRISFCSTYDYGRKD